MEEKGAHKKGSGPASTQCPSGHLFRRANTRRRVGEKGTRTETEKVAQEFGTTTEEVGCQRRARGLGYVTQRMGISASQQ